MNCVICEKEIPSKRLEILPGTRTCVNCSTTGRYKGVVVQLGEGDHTCNETIIMKEEEAWRFEQSEKELRKNIELEEQKESLDDSPIIDNENDIFIELISANADIIEEEKEEDDSLLDDPYVESNK